ncbi:transcription initiation factor TFIID subunit 4-like [Hordeum vulgare]|nr:transcription initiation factor TFIID subunit 4-like [Hordeum vulgare]
MRPPTDREPAMAGPPPPRQRLGQAPRPFRAAEEPTARGPPPVVADRARPPEPRPRPSLAEEGRASHEALLANVARPAGRQEGRAAREAPAAAAVARPPEQQHGAPEGRATREAPVVPVARPPEKLHDAPEGRKAPRDAPIAPVARSPEQLYGSPEVRAAREAPVATVARPPEPRPGPYYVPGGGAAAPVATTDRPPETSPSPWPYPYYYEPEQRPPRRRTSALASCLMAAAFLLFAAGGAATALFLLFRPQPPEIAVAAVRLPSFAAANGTVAFTFEQVASVRNPNRAPLAHFDSSLRVAYAGGEIGSIYIPAGLIDSGSTKHWSTTFAVPAFPAATPPPLDMAAQQPAAAAAVMEVDSLLVVKGKVMVLRVLTHRVQASKVCRVGVSPIDGRVLGFRC